MKLSVGGIRFQYNGVRVLDEVEFSVEKGEVLAILGPNGVGKTTLLRCINAMLRPSRGAVLVDGADVLSLAPVQVARRMGYVAQRGETPPVNAFDAVLLGRKPHMGWRVTNRDLEMVESVMRKLGLGHLRLRPLDRMSGGEAQKVNIARALVQEPEVLLLDEPTSSLDLKNQLEILRIVRDVARGHGVCAVMTMHDLNAALRHADKFLLLKDGRVHAGGARKDLTPEMIEAVYGVPVDLLMHGGHPVVLPRHHSQEEDHAHTH